MELIRKLLGWRTDSASLSSDTVIVAENSSTDSGSEQENLTFINEIPINDPSESETKREKWSGKYQFFLTCIGYCVGFGNIWRFPFLVYRNGGGAFLIPYFIFLVLCGIPLVFMELALGQFSSLTAIHLFGKFSPLFKGLGYAMVTISFFVCIYYNTIMSWVIYYLYSSFTSVLPWSFCDPTWASERCFDSDDLLGVKPNASEWFLSSGWSNETISRVPAAEEFWNRHVLRLSSGIGEIGAVRTELLICLLIAWICVFICSFKGIKWSGKIIYFTATFPFFMLIVLLIRGVTLPGSWDGIMLFIYPDFGRLNDFQVWIDAAMQIFYAMAPGWGGLLSFASFNEFHVDIYKYGIIMTLVNIATSLVGGFAVFSVIGFLAQQTGVSPFDVVTQGPGLTFAVYPAALAQLPFAPVWSVIFFATLFTVGIDSQFGMFDTFLSTICDEVPFVKRHRGIFCGISCVILWLLGIICVTESGMYWVQVIDWYCAFLTLMVICTVECVLVGWVYGADRFRSDIALMIGYPIGKIWNLAWKFVTPLTVVTLLFCNFYFHVPPRYEDYSFPLWSQLIGWFLAFASVIPIPLYAAYKILTSKGAWWTRVTSAVIPTEEYGPANSRLRQLYLDLTSGVKETADPTVLEKAPSIVAKSFRDKPCDDIAKSVGSLFRTLFDLIVG